MSQLGLVWLPQMDAVAQVNQQIHATCSLEGQNGASQEMATAVGAKQLQVRVTAETSAPLCGKRATKVATAELEAGLRLLTAFQMTLQEVHWTLE